MKILCKIFDHKWVYYKQGGDFETLFRTCKNCRNMSYKHHRTPGWVGMFPQSTAIIEREMLR